MLTLDKDSSSQEYDSITSGKSVLPFLKWPGGKRALAAEIIPLIGFVEGQGKYFEPFLGGAAVFFALQPQRAILSDVNSDLMDCYWAVRESPKDVAARLATMPNSRENYYKVRASRPTSDIGRAARLIYLTSLSFNGIYRQNLKGVFNVPYGHKDTKRLPSYSELLLASISLRGAKLISRDFEEVTSSAVSGDTIYFDPPYTVAHNNNGFVKYNASIFSWEDQRRLAAHAIRLANLGCRVVVSNADHPSVRNLYRCFRTKIINRHSVIAASSSSRGKITECLFISTPP